MRKQQTIKFPLSKASQVKVRADYKKNNGLAKNCTLESVYRSLGIFNEKQAFNVMAEMYNNRIEKDNQNVDVKRQEKKISIKNLKSCTIILAQILFSNLKIRNSIAIRSSRSF